MFLYQVELLLHLLVRFKISWKRQDLRISLLFCQPRVEVTSCFVYKVMGLAFHDRINTQLIYWFELAQVVARRITKPQGKYLRLESHWLLCFIHFFFIFWGRGVWFYYSFHVLFIFYFLLFFLYLLSLFKWRNHYVVFVLILLHYVACIYLYVYLTKLK